MAVLEIQSCVPGFLVLMSVCLWAVPVMGVWSSFLLTLLPAVVSSLVGQVPSADP